MRARKIDRVLLIRPPMSLSRDEIVNCMPPLGLAYIAAVLEKEYRVRILDAFAQGYHQRYPFEDGRVRCGLSEKEIAQSIREYSPDLVGVSCLWSMDFENAHELCRIAKGLDKDVVTIMGGAHPTAVPEEVLADCNVDYVVIGEGEDTVLSLLGKLNDGQEVSELDGIAYRDGSGQTRVNPKSRYISNLDQLPFPARHLLPMDKYFELNLSHGRVKRAPVVEMITSRGCPANCVFCSIQSIWGRKYRARTVENVLDEISFLVQEYGIKEIHFEDDNITLNRERARKLFEGIIDRKLDIAWSPSNGIAVWTLDREMLELMKRSGCYSLYLGIESGDQEVLTKVIGKPLKLDKVKEVVKTARELNIEVYGLFVVGFPGESLEQVKRTLHLARHLGLDGASIFYATPLPGTRLYQQCQEKGLLNADYSYKTLSPSRISIVSPNFETEELWAMVESEKRYHLIRTQLLDLYRRPLRVIGRGLRNPRIVSGKVRKLLGR